MDAPALKGVQKRKMTVFRRKLHFCLSEFATNYRVKTFSGKVVKDSLECLTVHKLLVGSENIRLNVNFVCKVNHRRLGNGVHHLR